MGVSLAAAAALEPQEQMPVGTADTRKEPLKSCNAAEATVASPNSLLFLPNKNKVMRHARAAAQSRQPSFFAAAVFSCESKLAVRDQRQPASACRIMSRADAREVSWLAAALRGRSSRR